MSTGVAALLSSTFYHTDGMSGGSPGCRARVHRRSASMAWWEDTDAMLGPMWGACADSGMACVCDAHARALMRPPPYGRVPCCSSAAPVTCESSPRDSSRAASRAQLNISTVAPFSCPNYFNLPASPTCEATSTIFPVLAAVLADVHATRGWRAGARPAAPPAATVSASGAVFDADGK